MVEIRFPAFISTFHDTIPFLLFKGLVFSSTFSLKKEFIAFILSLGSFVCIIFPSQKQQIRNLFLSENVFKSVIRVMTHLKFESVLFKKNRFIILFQKLYTKFVVMKKINNNRIFFCQLKLLFEQYYF